jgi:hypothetical protein
MKQTAIRSASTVESLHYYHFGAVLLHTVHMVRVFICIHAGHLYRKIHRRNKEPEPIRIQTCFNTLWENISSAVTAYLNGASLHKTVLKRTSLLHKQKPRETKQKRRISPTTFQNAVSHAAVFSTATTYVTNRATQHRQLRQSYWNSFQHSSNRHALTALHQLFAEEMQNRCEDAPTSKSRALRRMLGKRWDNFEEQRVTFARFKLLYARYERRLLLFGWCLVLFVVHFQTRQIWANANASFFHPFQHKLEEKFSEKLQQSNARCGN